MSNNIILYLLERAQKGKASKTAHTTNFSESADSGAKDKPDFRTLYFIKNCENIQELTPQRYQWKSSYHL